jgi:hypothetical protein
MKSGKLAVIFILALTLLAQVVIAQDHPDPAEIIKQVKQENLKLWVEKMESFENRSLLANLDSKTRGLKAAREWVAETFKSFSPRLQVFEDAYFLKAGGRVAKDTYLANVIAVLPGKSERVIAIGGHLDSIARNPETGRFEFDNHSLFMPGANDDASGVAATLECARILSKYDLDCTIYFIAFTGEESGLLGSRLLAERLVKNKVNFQGILNNDMISNPSGGNGITDTATVRVFSPGPQDSISRNLARYFKEIVENYIPSLEVRMIFRRDRFGRGGDHTSFNQQGLAGIRITESKENFANQHTVKDVAAAIHWGYLTTNAKANLATLYCLAMAPDAPDIRSDKGRLLYDRGESGYDIRLRWQRMDTTLDYWVLMRDTTSPVWQKRFFVGKKNEYTIPDVCLDDVVVGVQAVNPKGFKSQVSVYTLPARGKAPLKADVKPWPEM